MTFADKARPDAWAALEPYAQLTRALLPRAAGIAVFDVRANLRWSNVPTSGPDLVRAVEESIDAARRDPASAGEARLLDGEDPLYLCWLREENSGELIAVVAIPCRQASQAAQCSFSFVYALIRPALECLRRELAARVSLDSLLDDLSERDRDLALMLAVSGGEEAAATEDGVATLASMLEHGVEHLRCALAALLVPEKNVVMYRLSPTRPAEGQVLARSHRHLLSLAQVRREPLIMNRVAPGSSLGDLPFKILSCALRGPQGRVIGALALFRHADEPDFGAREARLVEVLARKAVLVVESSHDATTGLMNRPAFEERVRALARIDRARELSALYIDVDQLHLVNENFGMHVGDQVLGLIGDTLRRGLPPGAIASRISGDRFAAVVPAGLDDATALADAIRGAAGQLTAVPGDPRSRVSLSVGVAALEPGEPQLAHALAEAETACKAAKDRGRNRVEVYQAADESVVRRFTDITIAASLRAAIAEDRLRLDAQLILPLADAPRQPHFELLLRMIDDAGVTVGPDRFLSAANRYQLMPTIDRWVIARSLELLRPHADLLAGAPVSFALNFSGQSLNDAGFVDELIESVQASGIDPEALCFELTESAAIAQISRAEQLMRRLRKLGCGVALDDFGTGLSSLAWLRQLPVSMLKIDGSFIRDIARDPRAESLVQAIAQLARSMQIATVAEYVETDEIRYRVAALGVDYGQGFAIGRPEPLTEVLRELPVFVAAAASAPAQAPEIDVRAVLGA